MKDFDGIIIGAGHHALILANYLVKAGLNIVVVERRLQYGGGLSTEEVTKPGFYHNLHSINHFETANTPWYKDLELGKKAPYITAPIEFAQPHKDGSGLTISRNLDKTLNSIQRFSKKDAESFEELNKKAELWSKYILMNERFAEPIPKEEREALLKESDLGKEFFDLTQKQPIDVVKDHISDERLRVLLLFKLSIFGTIVHDTVAGTGTSPTGSFVRAFDLSHGYQLAKGGSWNLAKALMETYLKAGGHYMNQTEVESILIENNRATGVTLTTGETLRASQFVASTVDVKQTFESFIGTSNLPEKFRKKTEDFHYTKWGLLGVHLALKEQPKYTAASFDPDINSAFKYQLGAENIDEFMEQHEEIGRGIISSDPQIGVGSMTMFDPSQAPKGMHTAYAWQPVPWVGEEIEGRKDEYMENIIEKWSKYAPNLTDSNIVGKYAYTPWEYSQSLINMRKGDFFMGSLSEDQSLYNHIGYRTHIPNLYMAGSASHPRGAISGGAGYNVASIIADDLGLEKWWDPIDVRKAILSLKNYDK